MQLFKKLSLLIAAFLISSIALVGCNTVEGAGKDVEAVGEGVQDAVDDD